MRFFTLITLVLLLGPEAVAAPKGQSSQPKVLMIGDIITRAVSYKTKSALKNKVHIKTSEFIAMDSGTLLKNIDKLLMGEKWDLIYFNSGFNDIMYKDPSSKSVRAMHKDVGGVQVTSPEKYAANLKGLIAAFKKNGAKVVWASTTPIYKSTGALIKGDEVKYNQIAEKIMKSQNIAVINLYDHAKEVNKKIKNPRVFNYNRSSIHEPVVKMIMRTLNVKKN